MSIFHTVTAADVGRTFVRHGPWGEARIRVESYSPAGPGTQDPGTGRVVPKEPWWKGSDGNRYGVDLPADSWRAG